MAQKKAIIDADTTPNPLAEPRVRGGARDGADIHLAARIRERDGCASETGLMCGIRTGRDIVSGTHESGFARRGDGQSVIQFFGRGRTKKSSLSFWLMQAASAPPVTARPTAAPSISAYMV